MSWSRGDAATVDELRPSLTARRGKERSKWPSMISLSESCPEIQRQKQYTVCVAQTQCFVRSGVSMEISRQCAVASGNGASRSRVWRSHTQARKRPNLG